MSSGCCADSGTSSANSRSVFIFCMNGYSVALSATRSILFVISSVGMPGGIRSSTFWSSGPKRPASITNRITSTDVSVDVTARFSDRFSAVL